MSILLVDEGNTAAKFVLTESQQSDLVAINLAEIDRKDVKHIVAASVKAPSQSIVPQLADDFNCAVLQIETQSEAFTLKNAYADYARLGVDRWLAMLGAMQISEGPCIVIDAGTAITIDVVNGSKQHMGGWILPSSHFSAQALAERTGKIKLNFATQVDVGLGNSTEACVFNALYASQLALIEKLIMRLTKDIEEISENLAVIITGGDAPLYAKLLAENPAHIVVEPHLVFRGLQRFIPS